MSRIEEIQKQIEELENKTNELKKELECEKQKEVECPFKCGDRYFLLSDNGIVVDVVWEDYTFDNDAWSQGNAFEIEEEAEKESDRRALLKRFRQFRDKCNGDWKPDWNNSKFDKFFISSYIGDFDEVEIFVYMERDYNHFSPFGYFKNEYDAKRALELFGNEIKRLWVEEK